MYWMKILISKKKYFINALIRYWISSNNKKNKFDLFSKSRRFIKKKILKII